MNRNNHLEGGWWFEHSDYTFAQLRTDPDPSTGRRGRSGTSLRPYYTTCSAALRHPDQPVVSARSLSLFDQRLKVDLSFKARRHHRRDFAD